MKLLVSEGGGRSVALFGTGLIGSAIDDALCNQGVWQSRRIPYDWQDDARRHTALATIGRAIEATAEGERQRCDIIWAAGISGFGAMPSHMEGELRMVAELCSAADALANRHAELAVIFHLISSAGGLFEGKTNIHPETKPMPLRPYGTGKLEQEGLVLALQPRVAARIYRPASAYGFRPGARQGLFAALIANALSNQTSLISGSERTLRDYVFNRDIGKFVADNVLAPAGGTATYLLASGKPTSMFEAIALIERLLARPLYRRFESRASNARDLSFASSGLPPGLMRTPLEAGLAWLKTQIQNAVIRRGQKPWSGRPERSPLLAQQCIPSPLPTTVGARSNHAVFGSQGA